MDAIGSEESIGAKVDRKIFPSSFFSTSNIFQIKKEILHSFYLIGTGIC